MKFFIDTADIDEIKEAMSWGCLAGVTTNPSLYARTGGKLADFEGHMAKIAEICKGLPVPASSSSSPSALSRLLPRTYLPLRAFAST